MLLTRDTNGSFYLRQDDFTLPEGERLLASNVHKDPFCNRHFIIRDNKEVDIETLMQEEWKREKRIPV